MYEKKNGIQMCWSILIHCSLRIVENVKKIVQKKIFVRALNTSYLFARPEILEFQCDNSVEKSILSD